MRNVLLAAVLCFAGLAGVARAQQAQDPFAGDKLYDGYVCDSSCNAVEKHSPCKDKCPAAGHNAVLVSGDKVITIDNPDTVEKRDLGQRVQVRGKMLANGSLHVDLLHRVTPGGDSYDGH